MKPLFHEPRNVEKQLEKVAMRTKLGSDPSSWGTEILDAVYREHPYMKAFEVDVTIDRRDEGSGTAVGKVLVYPTLMTKEAASQGGRLIGLPIVVRNRELWPLDVYTHGDEVHPVDREELEGVLHRPEVFGEVEAAGRRIPEDARLNLQPPDREGSGGLNGSFEKAAAAGGIWPRLAPRVDAGALDAYLAPLAGRLPGAVGRIRSAFDAEKVAGTADVVQVSGAPGNYVVKVASRNAFAPSERGISDLRARQLAGNRVGELDERGFVTISRRGGAGLVSEREKLAEARTPGIYEVPSGGRLVPAIVFPQMRTIGGSRLDRGLVLGRDWYAEPEKIAGKRLRDLRAPVGAELPRGRVVPVAFGSDGSVEAYEPVVFGARITEGEKVAAVVHRVGSSARLTAFFEDGLQKIAHASGDEWLFPLPSERFAYLPYPEVEQRRGLDDARYARSLEDLQKQASTVRLTADGATYRLRDASPLLPAEADAAGMAFSLAALGVPDDLAVKSLRDARMPGSSVTFEKVAHLTAPTRAPAAGGPVSTRWRGLVSALLDPASVELYKAAGVTVRGQTPSDLLALDFVTPENARLYVNFLPDLEKAASQLAELVLASRLGYDTIREAAARNAMTQVRSVVSDLRSLQDKVR